MGVVAIQEFGPIPRFGDIRSVCVKNELATVTGKSSDLSLVNTDAENTLQCLILVALLTHQQTEGNVLVYGEKITRTQRQ